jgi:hypothetical protein
MAKATKRTSDDARSSEAAPNAGVLGEGVAAVYLPVDAPRPHPKNTRLHGQEVLRLARTIVRTTWGAPLIVQRSTMRIIGGHGRQLAAQEILAGIEVDGVLRGGHEHYFDRDAPGPGLIPVRLVDVSDAEADAMTLADNAPRLQGRDDAALIVEMAAGFGRESALMADIGFDGAALDALVRQAGDAVIGGAMGDPASAFGALPDGDKSPFQHVGFTLSDAQAETVTAAIEKAMAFVDDGNPAERRAAALTCVCEAFVG